MWENRHKEREGDRSSEQKDRHTRHSEDSRPGHYRNSSDDQRSAPSHQRWDQGSSRHRDSTDRYSENSGSHRQRETSERYTDNSSSNRRSSDPPAPRARQGDYSYSSSRDEYSTASRVKPDQRTDVRRKSPDITSRAAASKRRWDQEDTPQESMRKKLETEAIPISHQDTSSDIPGTMKLGTSSGDQEKPQTSGNKMGFSLGMSKSKLNPAPIKMSLGGQKPKEAPVIIKPKQTVESVFNEESESDEEEMPVEARMRMRNIGRNTPTAAGPNSYGKGRLGFCDRQRMIQKEIELAVELEEKTTPYSITK